MAFATLRQVLDHATELGYAVPALGVSVRPLSLVAMAGRY